MMLIGITNNFFASSPEHHTDYRKMKSFGFDCTDYQFLANPDGPLCRKLQPDLEKFLEEERHLADESGVQINQVHGPWPVDDRTTEKRKSNFEHMKKAVAGACILGAEHLVIHPVMPYGWGAEDDTQRAEEINVEIFTRLCEFAKPYNVTVCIENLPFKNITLSHVPNIKKFVDKLGIDNFKICLDTGHANMYPEDIGDMTRLCEDSLACLHVHDNNKRDDAHVMPYMGNLDWKSFMKALKDIGYNGVFSLEIGMCGNTPEEIKEDILRLTYKTATSLLK